MLQLKTNSKFGIEMMIIGLEAIKGHKTLFFQLQHDQHIDFDIYTNLETLKRPSLTIRRMRYSTDAPFDGCRKLIRRMRLSMDAAFDGCRFRQMPSVPF